MTAKAVHHLILGETAAKRFLQRLRDRSRRPNGEIQPFHLVVITEEAFIESSLVLNDVSLAGLALSESVEDREGDGLFPVRDSEDALITLAPDLISVRPTPK